MTNKEIARVLSETAALIELTGGNRYRASAFDRAARTLRGLDEPVTQRLEAGTLTDLSGIGKGLAADIRELVTTGSLPAHDELMSAIPPGLLDVLQVKGLGTKKVRTLWTELGITSLEELDAAAQSGQIKQLDGFGAKTQQNIIENVQLLRQYSTQHRYAEARTEVEPLLQALRSLDAVDRAATSGLLRRRLETLERADLIVASTQPDAIASALADHDLAPERRTEDGTLVFDATLADGLPLHVWVAAPERFGTVQWQITGSDEHRAVFRDRFGTPDSLADEEALYASVDLAFIAPELREGTGELEAAAENTLPSLITPDDLRGTLHNHSTYSDGAHSLRQMAETARELGYAYFGICDHSQSLTVAGGLSLDEVRAQQEEIQALNAEFDSDDGPPFRIFSGIESDILPDGSLDYEDEVLASFDFVVASIHSRFNMSVDEATERIVRAVQNPFTTILGHPTGRLLLVREGYPIDHERVIDTCAEHDVTIELNANPYRLDLDWRWIRAATDRGVLIAINPDAHSIDELRNVRWGVAVARKGWLTPDQCLNAKSLDAFADWLDARTARSAA